MKKESSYNKPLYKQIIENILSKIRSHELKAGDKLPTEYELANIFSVSRGTVRVALNMLCQNRVLEAVQGSGYYIAKTQDILDEKIDEEIINNISHLIKNLKHDGITDNEIRYYFHLAMARENDSERKIKLVVIECNPDIIPVYFRQLSRIPEINIDYCIIGTENLFSETLTDADIVVTTPKHFKQVIQLRPDIIDKIFRYNISINRETLLQLAKLKDETPLGILCISQQFSKMVKDTLEALAFNTEKIKVIYDAKNLPNIIDSIKVLITPVSFSISDKQTSKTLKNFLKNKGQKIEFDYQIEKGSLAFIKEQVLAIKNNQKNFQNV